MDSIVKFFANLFGSIFTAFSKLVGSLFIFFGLIGLVIEFKTNRLTSLEGLFFVVLFLFIGYKLVKEKNKIPQELQERDRIFLSSTLRKIVILFFLVPFLLYLLKHNIDEKKFIKEILGLYNNCLFIA